MGDYATYLGSEIKIGTTGDMHYLRPDQIDKVEPVGAMKWDDALFRFPFPDEDKNEPGDFDDHTRGFRVWGYEVPREIDHHKVQFKASPGILVSLPCPFSTDGIVFSEANKVKFHYNGYTGPAKIIRQRMYGGHWATVLECGNCGKYFRLPSMAEAEPLIDALRKMAAAERQRQNESYALTIEVIAARVELGYYTPATVS